MNNLPFCHSERSVEMFRFAQHDTKWEKITEKNEQSYTINYNNRTLIINQYVLQVQFGDRG
ncbi:MAG: hypothetical protein K6G73_06220 [Marinilabiliaceae bacterium]|nr:hypothetical protein [Marinilabiliaceae bacterium]